MPPTRELSIALLAGLALFCATCRLPGIVFFETGDLSYNRERAPAGLYEGAGWRYQGEYKEFLGTAISPRHFITAVHLGKGSETFVQRSWFTGEEVDRVYFINPNFNEGNGSLDIPGTDLRIFEVFGEFPAYAGLYTTSDEAGREVVMMGRGRARGEAVRRFGQTRGWSWAPEDERARWGRNTVDGFSEIGNRGPMLVTDFDDVRGRDECQATMEILVGEFLSVRKELGSWQGFFLGLIQFMTQMRSVGMVPSFWHPCLTGPGFMSDGMMVPVTIGLW